MAKVSSLSVSVIVMVAMLFPSVSRADLPASFFDAQKSGGAGQTVEGADKSQDSIAAATDAECAGSSCQAGAVDASDDQGGDEDAAAERGDDLLAPTGAAALLLLVAASSCLVWIRKNRKD